MGFVPGEGDISEASAISSPALSMQWRGSKNETTERVCIAL